MRCPRPKPGRHASKEQQRRRHTSRDRQGACTVAVCEHRTARLPISSCCVADCRCQFRPRPHRRVPTAAPSYRAAWEASWGEFTIVGISSSPPIKAATTPIPNPAISPATTRTTAPSSGEPSSPKWLTDNAICQSWRHRGFAKESGPARGTANVVPTDRLRSGLYSPLIPAVGISAR